MYQSRLLPMEIECKKGERKSCKLTHDAFGTHFFKMTILFHGPREPAHAVRLASARNPWKFTYLGKSWVCESLSRASCRGDYIALFCLPSSVIVHWPTQVIVYSIMKDFEDWTVWDEKIYLAGRSFGLYCLSSTGTILWTDPAFKGRYHFHNDLLYFQQYYTSVQEYNIVERKVVRTFGVKSLMYGFKGILWSGDTIYLPNGKSRFLVHGITACTTRHFIYDNGGVLVRRSIFELGARAQILCPSARHNGLCERGRRLVLDDTVIDVYRLEALALYAILPLTRRVPLEILMMLKPMLIP